MKNIWKYIFIGLGALILEWIFIALFFAIFNGLDQASGVVMGTGFFLAFEMVICTGVIISKINASGDKKQ